MISILVPTRHRAHRVKNLLASVRKTVSRLGAVEVVLYVDDDDGGYKGLPTYGVNLVVTGGPKPLFLSATYNVMMAAARGAILCYAADDIVFCSKGWDLVVEAEFKKSPVLLLGVDLTHGFVSKEACLHLGYFFPPNFEHGYADHWLHQVYDAAGFYKQTNAFCLDHQHWHADEKLLDDVYVERGVLQDGAGKICDDRDRVVFDDMAAQRVEDSVRLLKFGRSLAARPPLA